MSEHDQTPEPPANLYDEVRRIATVPASPTCSTVRPRDGRAIFAI